MFSSSRCRIAVALLTLAAVPGVGRAATPYLVKDIRTGDEPAASQPRELGRFGAVATFIADAQVANELWKSDGTTAGTQYLADLCAGECSTTPRLLASTPIGAFYATDAGTGALWLTRGSGADTVQVAKDVKVPDGPGVWVAALGKLFFTAFDAARGIEPWVSDGTAAGTRSLDVRAGEDSSMPGELAAFAGRLYFAADHDGGGAALWTSDGTPAGTKLVLRTAPGNWQSPSPRFLTSLGKRLVFFAPKVKKGVELWASDGTTKGTTLLADLASSWDSPDVHFVQAVGARAFLGIDTPKRGYELWVTDGTAKGTQSLGLPSPGPLAYDAAPALLPLGDGKSAVIPRRVAPDFNHWEPWVSNGTRAGTRLLADLCPGPSCALAIRPLSAVGSRSLFTAVTAPLADRYSQELWVTDGKTAGTARVAELCAGCADAPRFAGNLAARVLFTVPRSAGWDLWITDGTAAGTTRLTEGVALQTRDSGALATVQAGSVVLFAARDEAHNVELWQTDGTAAGTHLISDVATANLASSRPRRFAAAGERVYFLAEDGEHGYEPWTSDGTAAGTHLVADFVPGPSPTGFHDSSDWQLTTTAALGSDLVFPRRSGDDGLWRSDGTAAGTVKLTPLGITARAPVAVGATVFFIGALGNDVQLWKTDGTPAGTARLTSIEHSPRSLAAWNGKLYFLVDDDDGTGELWRSDGTTAGTVPVADVNVGDRSTLVVDPRALTAAPDALYFMARGTADQLWRSDGTAAGTEKLGEIWPYGNVLKIVPFGSGVVVFTDYDGWVSDGTPAGTRRIDAIRPPWYAANEMRPVAVGGAIYFQGLGPLGYAGPNILWRTDGTEAGTYPMIDARGHTFAAAESLRAFGGKLVFAAADGGYEALWESDGTPLGTRVVHRLGARPDYGWLGELAVVGSRLYFAAFSHDHGMELWALPAQ